MKTKILFVAGVAVLLPTATILADVREGLVSYWPMNAATGAYPLTTPDAVAGNDLSGPNMDSATAVVAGKFGNAIAFDGGAAYLVFTNVAGADSGLPVARQGSWTYSLWVNGPGGQPDQTTYFAEASGYSPNWRFAMEMEITAGQTEKTRYFIRDGANTTKASFVGTTNTLDNTWHHVAYTYDATNSRFLVYVDGQPNYTNTFTYAQFDTTFNSVGVGALVRNTVGVPFAGSIDEVALWARALSQAEVQDVYNNSIATPVPVFAPVVTVNPTGATLYEGDNYTLQAGVHGSRPLGYQWIKHGTNLPGATLPALALANVATTDSGPYQLVVTNSSGSATSAVAQATVNAYGSPNLTNGIVAYWPLDTIDGVKTPDLVSAYDLTVNNMGGSNVVAGKWGSALSFSAASSQFARRIHNPGDNLPIYSKSNFTVSFWAKAASSSSGWAFGECSTLQNNTAFVMGKLNSGSLGMDGFCRDDFGQPSGDHRISSATFWDDTWHNVVWVQRDVGGSPKALMYIDGVLDPVNLNPRYPITPNNTALGAFARATPAQFFTGEIDEVVFWERPLSAAEISLIQTGYITNPPVRLSPLTINSFKSDLPAVAQGDSTVLRWDVPANASQVLLEPLGDVTALTTSGLGTTNVTLTNTTTFVLTVIRDTAALGHEEVRATNRITVVEGVAADWTLLDNFDSYSPGLLAGAGPWVDMYGNSLGVVAPTNCNRLVKTLLATSGAYLKLNSLAVNSNQSATLFFRMIPQGNPPGGLTQPVGITDASVQFYYQLANNVGPFVRPTVNDPSQNPGDWLLAARDIPFSPLTYDTNVLQVGSVYSVWIDVTNVFIGDRVYPDNYDLFSVYLQKEGAVGRTLVFSNFTSDRDLLSNDPLTGGPPTDNLSRVYLGGNSDTYSALFDDFYLSKSGYNATIPRPFGYGGPSPLLQLQQAGNQWQVVFEGKLLEAPSVNGPWTEVTGATSPYAVTTSGGPKFYRAVCN